MNRNLAKGVLKARSELSGGVHLMQAGDVGELPGDFGREGKEFVYLCFHACGNLSSNPTRAGTGRQIQNLQEPIIHRYKMQIAGYSPLHQSIGKPHARHKEVCRENGFEEIRGHRSASSHGTSLVGSRRRNPKPGTQQRPCGVWETGHGVVVPKTWRKRLTMAIQRNIFNRNSTSHP